MMDRRDFLKTTGGVFAALLIKPVISLVPPRRPFVQVLPGLSGLYAHLGLLPSTRELNICEGHILEIEEWDGTGYPCLVENACSSHPQRTYIHDFDLYNFRFYQNEYHNTLRLPSRYACLYKRFGEDAETLAKTGGGWVGKRWDIDFKKYSERVPIQ